MKGVIWSSELYCPDRVQLVVVLKQYSGVILLHSIWIHERGLSSLYVTLAASGSKSNASVWRSSVCPSAIRPSSPSGAFSTWVLRGRTYLYVLVRHCTAACAGRHDGDMGASHCPHLMASSLVVTDPSLRHSVPHGRAVGAASDRLRQRHVVRLDDGIARRHLPVPTVRRRRRRTPQRTIAVRQRPDNRPDRKRVGVVVIGVETDQWLPFMHGSGRFGG